jgi:hypothetical protein
MGNAAEDTAAKVDNLAASSSKAAEASRELSTSKAGTVRAAQSLNLIAAASTGNINGMARAVAGLSKAFGPITLIIATFAATFKATTAAMNWVWANFVDNIKGVEPVLAKTRQDFDELNKVKLDTLTAEVANIRKEADAVLSTIERAVARAAALRNAEAAAEKARILAEDPAGPERDLKIAALEKRTAEADIAAREDVARRKLEELAKQEEAMRTRLAEAEKADQEIQEKAAKAKARVNEERSRGQYNAGFIKAAVQVNQQAQSSAESLAALRAQFEPQLAGIGESRAEAENQLAITGAQRSTTGSQFTAAQQAASRQQAEAQRKASAAAAREELKAKLAAAAEREALIKQQQQDEMPGREAFAASEQADVASADAAIADFKRGSKYAPQSHSYQSQLRELEAIRQKEQAEADAAIAAARETAQALGQALRSVTKEIENIKANIANLEN